MKTYKKIREMILWLDYFGLPLSLNFNKSGDNIHRTFLGAIISSIIQIMMLTYIIILII